MYYKYYAIIILEAILVYLLNDIYVYCQKKIDKLVLKWKQKNKDSNKVFFCNFKIKNTR